MLAGASNPDTNKRRDKKLKLQKIVSNSMWLKLLQNGQNINPRWVSTHQGSRNFSLV